MSATGKPAMCAQARSTPDQTTRNDDDDVFDMENLHLLDADQDYDDVRGRVGFANE